MYTYRKMFEDPNILTLIRTLRDYAGYDFANYSEKSFLRRVEKVMMDYKLDLSKLIAKVKEDMLKNFFDESVLFSYIEITFSCVSWRIG